MARTKGAVNVSDKKILEGLHEHCVKDLKSKYTMYKPVTWRAIDKRMNGNEAFTDKVHTIMGEADAKWEQVGLKALMSDNKDFNTALYKMFVSSKRSFLSYQDGDLQERITKLEEVNNDN